MIHWTERLTTPPVADIERHAAQLTPEHHMILKASAANKTMKEIAGEQRIPLGTAKSRLNRARTTISKFIALENADAIDSKQPKQTNTVTNSQ